MELQNISIEEFENEIYNKYIKLFPEEEQRDWTNIKRTYNKGIESFINIVEDSKTIGFIMLEKLKEDFPYYIDYFAIFEELQGKGYGTKAIKLLLTTDGIKENGICLEIEKETTDDENTIKRSKFYKELGFRSIDSEYNLYNVRYTPYVYDKNNRLDKETVDKIMFEYYKENCGEIAVKKNCKLVK